MTGREVSKLAVSLAMREAMREHRKGKPIAFSSNWWRPYAAVPSVQPGERE